MSPGTYSDTIKHRGFVPFFWTQFLGAFNDNFYKIVVSMVALNAAADRGGGSAYISLIGALFILPFFLFSGYAGHLADVYSKRTVLVMTKSFEIVAMGFAWLAFLSERIELMLIVIFLMALQSTFFSPAKYGILPEMLPDKDLSRGNGLLEMSTFLAIILGTSLGGGVYSLWKNHLSFIAVILILIAVAGTVTSLGIARVPPSGSTKPFGLNPWAEIGGGLKRLYQDQVLWLAVIGISYFWFLGALLQMNILFFGKELLGLDEFRVGLLVAFIAIGIGAGSLAAGRLSGDKVELGLVPLGSFAMCVFAFVLAAAPSFPRAAIALTLVGFSGGLFIVPLYALLQQRSGKEEKGRMIATNNFLNTAGILLASALLWTLHDALDMPADRVIQILGLLTLLATFYTLRLLPEFLIRFLLWMLTHTIYRIRIVGQEHVPLRGPALLVPNHVTFADPLLVGACLQRFVRFMMFRPYYELKALNWLFRLMRVIPVSAHKRRDIVESLERARKEIQEGHVVCLFAEGGISRTGHVRPFKRGLEKIVEGLDVPIIPVHLDRLWGSIFSFKAGRFFWKWPKRLPYPVTVSFGAPLPSTANAHEVQQAVVELGSDSFALRRKQRDLLDLKFVRAAKRHWFAFCMADATGRSLTYGKALIGSLLLSRWVKKHCAGQSMVGILLPASVGGALANIAVLLAGKVPVNLNFTTGREAMDSAVRQCGISTILTSRLFLSKAKLEKTKGMIHVDEAMNTIGAGQKALTALAALALPSRFFEFRHRNQRKPNDLATVIFSSGSTGTPKGIMLSHHNIISNIEGICEVISFTSSDRIMGVLPLFHSFGFTGTLWLPLINGFGAIYHSNPMDAKVIGEAIREHRATLFISTPTFFATYVRRCSAEDFASLRYAIAGAEKLRESTAKSFKEKFGLELLEGYGCTELAPVVSVNVPDIVDAPEHQIGHRAGTVGRPIPGVSVKITDPDSGEPLSPGKEGLLLVKGPNRMLGYLEQPDLSRQALRDGWYVTGDIGALDEEGFLSITDRLSRFSKIGGEMVPQIKVEEAINEILGNNGSVVTSVPDEQKGERLVAFYTQKEINADELWEKLSATRLPKLWIPKRESLHYIESIPILGTGKVDLKKVKDLAIKTIRMNGEHKDPMGH